MNLSDFISRKIREESKGTFASSIHRIAVISISVGLLSLLLAFMILGGFQKKISEKIYSFSGHLLISKFTLSSSFEESSIEIKDTLISQLEDFDFVTNWQYFAYKAGLLKTKDEVHGVIFKGVDYSFDTAYFYTNILRGRFPQIDDTKYSSEVALSNRIANYIQKDVGDEIMMFFVQNPPRYRKLKVTGIYETGLEEFDEKIIIGDINLIRRLNDWNKRSVAGVEVFVKDGMDYEVARNVLFNELEADLYVENVQDKYLQIFDWLALLNRNVAIFLVLILLVACFSMVSILLILIMERTQMIGILKSMGAPNVLIRKIFLSTGFNLVLKGLFWGNLIGLGLGYLQYRFELIPLDPVNYYMNYVPIEFDLFTIIALNAAVSLMISLSLLIPVRIISRIRPIRAIRFD